MAAHEMAVLSQDALAGSHVGEHGLVDGCRRGDPQAFARLVSLHEGMVFNLSCRLLGDTEEARDASQEVFLQVYRMLHRFQGRSTLRTWIYRIVVNHCRNRRRFWRRRHRNGSTPLHELTAVDEARLAEAARAETPEECAARRERARQVQSALLHLSFAHRAVLVLREVEGLSCPEIAEALGVAEGTVKSRLARARDVLRGRLERLREAVP